MCYAGMQLLISARERCVGSSSALRGAVRWRLADEAVPAVVQPTATAGNWYPAPGVTPNNGNFAYVEGQAGDFISQGRRNLYTPVDAAITVRERDGLVNIDAAGEALWGLQLRTAAGVGPVVPGVYAGLAAPVLDRFTDPHIILTGRGRGCQAESAWVAVDEAIYQNGSLQALSLRLEHRCKDALGGVRFALRWRADDVQLPPAPAAVPATFWQPEAGLVPSTGNAVVLNPTRSDFVAGGYLAVYTGSNARLRVTGAGNRLTLQVDGDEHWTSEFTGNYGQTRLQPGYYAGLARHGGLNNPARGALSWYGESRACNESRSGAVIDSIGYDLQGQVNQLTMRLEQHCSTSMTGALLAYVRWRADDSTLPPGPVNPPPVLWQAPAGVLPASGNYLYFESSVADFVGRGTTLLLTPAQATMRVQRDMRGATVFEAAPPGSIFPWTVNLQTMFNRPLLERGYYGALQKYPIHNPARGGMDIYGDGRGCNTIRGWYVVDDVMYANGALTLLQVRFEQVCEGEGVLRGTLRWVAP